MSNVVQFRARPKTRTKTRRQCAAEAVRIYRRCLRYQDRIGNLMRRAVEIMREAGLPVDEPNVRFTPQAVPLEAQRLISLSNDLRSWLPVVAMKGEILSMVAEGRIEYPTPEPWSAAYESSARPSPKGAA